MRFALLALLAAAAGVSGASRLLTRDHEHWDYYAIHVEPSSSPQNVALHFGLELDGQLGELRDHYMFRKHKHAEDIVGDAVRLHRQRRKRDASYQHDVLDSILLHQKQQLRAPHEKRGPVHAHSRQEPVEIAENEGSDEADSEIDLELADAKAKGVAIAKLHNISDPSFLEQWHLYNPIQLGHDLNVSGVWEQGITGKGATVCIIDDGLDFDSLDIKDNYYAEGSYDFNDPGDEPRPRLSDDRHGTRCAGEVSAVKNEVCGVGVAWDSKVAGIRILSKPITDSDEAVAMNYGFNTTQIYSCSWGPPDDGKEMGAPGILIKRAMVNAVQNGRGGLGSIYVFAAGNGAANHDNCNFDGYTNSIYSVTVGAIDRKGKHPYYSEECSAQLIVTYSSGSGDAIHTTDVGVSECYNGHGGTSAAGPLAVGVIALALEVRPDLSWRDVQWLSVNTAQPVDQPSDWQATPYGKNFSHQFGYGKLDAYHFVEAAKTFESVKPQAWYRSPWQHVRHEIPQGDQGLVSTFEVTPEMLKDANFERLEHITVTMNVEHTRRGDISVDLTSSEGIVSHLSVARTRDDFNGGYNDWTFMSVAHWGEAGAGTWTLTVRDQLENEHTGTFVDWKLNLFGECANADIQNLLPMPDAHDDDDHDREDAAVNTTDVEVASTTAPPPGNPTDHQDRPINQRPSDVPATSTPVADELEAVITEAPTPTYEDMDGVWETELPDMIGPTTAAVQTAPTESPTPTAAPSNDNLLPSPFPNFGVSKRTQIWIYGAAGLIIIFCISLAVYFWIARKKRQRALARENYEFEIVEDEEPEGRLAGGKRSKRRAGELYDAFAGGSDEEVFSDLDDDEDAPYHDEKARRSLEARRNKRH